MSVIKLEHTQEWDSLVKRFREYDVYYLSGYVKAFCHNGDGDAKLIYYEKDNIRAINVVMVRDIYQDKHFTSKISKDTYYDITTPYGYGGFLIQGNTTDEDLKQLEQEYCDYCREQGIVCEFARFHPIHRNGEKLKSMYEIKKLGNTVTINLLSEQQIWADLSSKNRNMIRKAKKAGVEIFWGRSPQLIEEFIPLYNRTMDKNHASEYYYFDQDFYHSMLYDLKYHADIFYASYENKIIAMSILLFANQQMNYHLSASDTNYRHLAPTNLLLYEAACWGHTNGYKTFHLGGGVGCKEDSLYQFKKSFHKDGETDYLVGKKIFDEKRYQELIKLRKIELLEKGMAVEEIKDQFEQSDYFPIYRV
nr:GNAT family N-acetyltransferase [Mobilitalea sibirica]